ncbi:14373_t:CDS:2, partial [Dentiscutata heterogama]
YDDLSTSSKQVYSPDFSNIMSDDLIILLSFQSTNKQLLSKDDINSDNKLGTDSAIKLLLAYLSENFSSYRKNKKKFYIKSALHIGSKTSTQVHRKVQSLIRKYSEEKKEKTGKGISKWPYFYLMNKIFGNSYIESIAAISESKKMSTEYRKKWNEDHAKI